MPSMKRSSYTIQVWMEAYGIDGGHIDMACRLARYYMSLRMIMHRSYNLIIAGVFRLRRSVVQASSAKQTPMARVA